MWVQFQPVKQVNIPGFLGDVESHLPDGHPYKDEDKVTWTHEGTHGVNSAIRNKEGGRKNAAYVLNNYAFVLEEPNFTLSKLAQEIPQDLRGGTYQLYLVQQQRYWNDRPLYVLDELSCYLNGTRAAIQLKVDSARINLTFNNAIEFLGYTGILYKLYSHADLVEMIYYVNVQLLLCFIRYENRELKTKYNKVQSYLPEDVSWFDD